MTAPLFRDAGDCIPHRGLRAGSSAVSHRSTDYDTVCPPRAHRVPTVCAVTCGYTEYYQGTTTPHWQQHSALPLVEVLLISGAFPEVGVWQTARRFFFCWSERPSFHAKHQAADDIVIVNSSLFLHFVGYACRPYKSAQPDYARDHGTAPDCGSSAQP